MAEDFLFYIRQYSNCRPGGLTKDQRDLCIVQPEYRNTNREIDVKSSDQPVPVHLWKFLHPANFPTLRLVPLAALFINSNNLFDLIINKLSKDLSGFKKNYIIRAFDVIPYRNTSAFDSHAITSLCESDVLKSSA